MEDESDIILQEMDQAMAVLAEGLLDLEAMQEILNMLEELDLHDDAPLTLEQAVHLPELGGYYARDANYRSRSETISVKTLRGAIERREIAPGWKGKNMFVTRRMLREWLEKCRDQGTTSRPSSSGRPDIAARAASRTRPSISSTTAASSTSLESARMILEQLRQPRQPSAPTSPKGTPKK